MGIISDKSFKQLLFLSSGTTFAGQMVFDVFVSSILGSDLNGEVFLINQEKNNVSISRREISNPLSVASHLAHLRISQYCCFVTKKPALNINPIFDMVSEVS